MSAPAELETAEFKVQKASTPWHMGKGLGDPGMIIRSDTALPATIPKCPAIPKKP